MATLPPALTRALGSALSADTAAGLTDPWESTPELAWPASLSVYDAMRRQDGQIGSILSAIKHPIESAEVDVIGQRVRPTVRDTVRRELGLVKDEDGRYRPRANGVSWDEFIGHVGLMLDFGHIGFEPIYQPGPPDLDYPGQQLPDGTPPVIAHLHKLDPRMPRTLASIDVAPDGGLAGVHQYVRRGGTTVSVPIPVDQLVWFCHRREGADWAGRSILRTAYKHWLLKDTALRIAALGIERTSMGLPVVHYPKNVKGAKKAALNIATKVRAGEDAGVALPDGWDLQLLGVTGTTRDPLPFIQEQDRAMGRACLTMVLDLGHDAGARSLGETFDAILVRALGRICRYIEEVVTEHIIRPFVRLNWGAEEPYPVLRFAPLQNQPATAEALAALADKGLLGDLDRELVDVVRSTQGLPVQLPEKADAVPQNSPFTEVGLPALVEAGIITEDEARGLLGLTGRAPARPAGSGLQGPTVDPAPGRPIPGPGGAGGGLPETQALPGTPVIGPQARVVPSGQGGLRAVPQAQAAAAGLPAGYVSETERIRERRDTSAARAPHPFKAATWTHPNGHPRCALCGAEERTDGRCPGSDHDGGTTSAPGSKGVAQYASAAGLPDLAGLPDDLRARALAAFQAIAATQGS